MFQISPGNGPAALRLACQAHVANAVWNACDARMESAAGPARLRTRTPEPGPANDARRCACHPRLHGEVRPPDDPRSSLYNTDGQIFSDAGIPVVLFMENYDINREGYHDTHDTMANIDLDYGAALAAIAIETVARAATENPFFARRGHESHPPRRIGGGEGVIFPRVSATLSTLARSLW